MLNSHADRNENLAAEVDKVVAGGAEELVQYICNDKRWPAYRKLHRLALKAADLTEWELERLGEQDDCSPRYTLYYSELTNLLQKTLARAIDRMSY